MAQRSIRIVEHIPRVARVGVAMALGAALAGANDAAGWERLLAFPKMVLWKPPRGYSEAELGRIIKIGRAHV